MALYKQKIDKEPVNFMWGGEVRKATPDEIKAFMVKVFYSEHINNY